ncbi:response regulator [Nakamurella sp.]|uniref:response regulator n=1 Tax=Nakamurella sp. TaxID=1869182 RepID=UPI003B3A0650
MLVVDDHALIRTGLAMLLNAQPDIQVVAEARDGAEAIAMAAEHQPDVVLMDVRMPGTDGVTATRHLVQEPDDVDHLVKVIILTTYNADDAVYAALRAGASGFLLKDAEPDELIRAVRAVAAGDGWLDPSVARRLISEFRSRPDTNLAPSDALAQLTARERQVLILMAHGLTNDDLVERLTVEMTTVKTHVGRILMKLAVHDRAQAVATAYQHGLVRPGDPPPRYGG